MSNLKIITNGHYRPLLFWEELTPKEQEDFDWEGANEDNFFRYKGSVYNQGDFMRVSGEEFAGWEGVRGDSYFSGVLIKFSLCGDGVKVGRFYQ